MHILDSSFNERDELTASHTMDLFVHPDDAARYGPPQDGQTVTLANERGQADFTVVISKRTVPGQVVSEGVWWRERVKGQGASVNVLTSQRPDRRRRRPLRRPRIHRTVIVGSLQFVVLADGTKFKKGHPRGTACDLRPALWAAPTNP